MALHRDGRRRPGRGRAAGGEGLRLNSGQICSAGTRLLVQDNVAQAFVDRVVACLRNVSVGPGIENRDMGPVISAGAARPHPGLHGHPANRGRAAGVRRPQAHGGVT
ncbi:aldehyde dehydrogenase family protein [Ottowia sp.]|uniref:aldehyde dehydrogenase family protein n=1 Tax=Ottowia sp. TaxID=1898956 RepID=UPI003453ECFC|nr:aldehyde dehydrogenase family protein [Ottowia sp.]